MNTNTIKVLLVDDDSKLRSSLRREFEDADFLVVEAISVAEARVILAHETFDVVLCDNQMAGTNGTRLLAEVSKEYPDMKRFMLTGDISSTQSFLVEKEIGVCGLFEKPCSSAKLIEEIRKVVSETD